MTVAFSSLPVHIQNELKQSKNYKTIKETCIIQNYPSGSEILIFGVGVNGKNFCKVKGINEKILAQCKKSGCM